MTNRMSPHATATTQGWTLRLSPQLGRVVRWLLTCLLITNLCLLLYYILVGYRGKLHSDAAVKNLLAQEIFETGRYFPIDWNYVNGDLFVLFGHTFILPLLLFFQNSYSLHAVAGLLSAALIVGGTWCLARVAIPSSLGRLFSLVVVTSGLSRSMAEDIFGQVSYGWVYYFACFIIFFAWRSVGSEGKARWLWGAGLAGLAVLAFWSNPQRAAAAYGLPIGATLIAHSLGSIQSGRIHWHQGAVRSLFTLGLFCVGACAGTALHAMIIGTVHDTAGAGYARWLTFEGMSDNLHSTTKGLLVSLGGLPSPSQLVLSVTGIYEAIRLAAALALLVALPYGLIEAIRAVNPGTRFLGIFALVSASVFLLLQIATTIPDYSRGVAAIRYLSPTLLLMILCLIASVTSQTSTPLKRVALVALAVLGASALPGLLTSNSLLTPYGSIRSEHPGQAKREALIAFLQSQGLRYGYATYWNAGAISVLSAQQVRIRQILVSNGLPIPMRHLSSDRWYSPSAWEGETFMLLTKSEAQQVDWELLDRYRVKPSKALKFDDWEVFVFPSNLAKDLPYWDTIFSYTQSIPLTKYSPHHIGRYVASDGQPMLVAEKGEQGFLHFGPYLRIASGTYRARYEVQAEGDKDSDFGFADVTSDGGTIVYSYTRISRPGLHTYEVDFTVPSWKGDLEFRVSTSGIARVQLRKIEVTRISD